MEIFNFKHLLLQRNTYRGLTSNQVIENTKKFGINARPKFSQKKWSKRLLGIVGEPMMLLLVATAGVYFFIGSKLEAIILTLSLIPIVLIEFLQEKKTDQAVAALDSLLVEECQVYRDGVLQKISVTNLVPGDLVYLVAGDKLPADGYLLRSPGALVDESILTGETVPVVKSLLPNDLDKITEEHKLNQGTLLVQGEGYMLVTTTGLETAYGKLGNLLQKIKQVNTPLENKIEHLVHWLAICAIIIALIIGVVLTLESGLIKGILGALTIAIAIIPEEFPIVFSVFLIMGGGGGGGAHDATSTRNPATTAPSMPRTSATVLTAQNRASHGVSARKVARSAGRSRSRPAASVKMMEVVGMCGSLCGCRYRALTSRSAKEQTSHCAKFIR
jgi:Ca2+-transporting ATPase